MQLLRNFKFWQRSAFNFCRLKGNGCRLRLRGIYKGYFIQSGVTVSFPNQVTIGKGVVIQKGAAFSISPSGQLEIGADSRIGSDAVFSVGGRVTLEENVLIAARCFIGDQNHRFDESNKPIMHQGASQGDPVRIGRGSWLGINVCIMPGVVLGHNCVVAAGSVVTKTFPPLSIVAGVPAKVIGRVGSYDPT